jgi:chromosomal replication initiation ATPase DnaA
MNYAPQQQLTAARHIARSAKNAIKDKTGMKVNLMLWGTEQMLNTPRNMLQVIAISQGMNISCYKLKSRDRDTVELRFLGALFLRMHFPMVTLQQIAGMFGGQDHSSIVNGIARAYNLLHTGDLKFITKYNKALNSVNLWLEKEVSGYASAISA